MVPPGDLSARPAPTPGRLVPAAVLTHHELYPEYVEDEVVANLNSAGQFERGPRETGRGTRNDHRHAFVVEDGNYVSARWPGDSYRFAQRFIDKLEGPAARPGADHVPVTHAPRWCILGACSRMVAGGCSD